VNELEAGQLPSSAEEGWLRGQEKVAKPPLFRADGVVLVNYRLLVA